MSDNPTNRDLLIQAIELNLRDRAEEAMPPEEELGDFIVVAAGVSIDSKLHASARYYVLFKDASMLPHVALGLMDRGDDVLRANTVESDED